MNDKTKPFVPVDESQVVDIVLAVLEAVSKKHYAMGRHELNRTDLETAIQELRVAGLPVGKKAGVAGLL